MLLRPLEGFRAFDFAGQPIAYRLICMAVEIGADGLSIGARKRGLLADIYAHCVATGDGVGVWQVEHKGDALRRKPDTVLEMPSLQQLIKMFMFLKGTPNLELVAQTGQDDPAVEGGRVVKVDFNKSRVEFGFDGGDIGLDGLVFSGDLAELAGLLEVSRLV